MDGAFETPTVGSPTRIQRRWRDRCAPDPPEPTLTRRATMPLMAHARRPLVTAALTTLLLAGVAAATEPLVVRNHAPQVAASPPDGEWTIDSPVRVTGDPLAADTAEAQLRLLVDLHSAGRLDDAEDVARAMVRRLPDHGIPRYNLACVLARQGRVDEALDALEAAIERGWRKPAHLGLDLDLHAVRSDQRYDEIRRELDRRRHGERVVPRPLRRDAPARIAADLQRRAPALLARYHVPGASIALVRGGRVAWHGAFGVTDLETRDGLDADARFGVEPPRDLLAMLLGAERERDALTALARAAAEPASDARRGVRTVAMPIAVHEDDAESRTGRPFDELRALLEATGGPIDAQIAGRYLDRWPLVATTLATTDEGRPAARAAGHTRLGTNVEHLAPAPDDEPLHPHHQRDQPRSAAHDQGRRAPVAWTTAADLGVIVAQILAASDARSDLDVAAVLDLYRAALLAPDAWPVRVETDDTGAILRAEIAGERDGHGCLLRWYPQSGTGVAILYNAEGGAPAAHRLAHVALGGW